MTSVWHRFAGSAQGGKFHPREPDRLKALLLELKGKDVEVAVRPARKNRTLDQNALIHVLANEIAEMSGHSVLEIKRFATLQALGAEQALLTFLWKGETLTDVRGTSELSTSECSAVLEVLIEQAGGLNIPRPNPEHYESL